MITLFKNDFKAFYCNMCCVYGILADDIFVMGELIIWAGQYIDGTLIINTHEIIAEVTGRLYPTPIALLVLILLRIKTTFPINPAVSCHKEEAAVLRS